MKTSRAIQTRGTCTIRSNLQGFCLLMVALLALGLFPNTLAQTPAPGSTQASPRVVEGVTFEPGATLLFLTPEQQRVAYRNVQLLAPTNLVARGRSSSPLPLTRIDLDRFTYNYENRERSLEDFITETRVAGLLVIKDGRIVAERYELGHTPDSVWTSFSVAKSILSLLYGAALRDGSLRSLDDSVTRYLPSLRGSAYDVVTLRQLLQMSSGVAWNEDETDRNSDLAQSVRIGRTGGIEALLAYMRRLPRKAAPGTVFNYNTAETNIAGAVLRAATRRSLAQYLSEKIWKPAGMEKDAYWVLLRNGDAEYGGCCLSATLRDYGRLGLLALRGGSTADGTHLVARNWIQTSTTPAPTASYYGNLWWLEEGGRYAASGLFGQYIYVDPEHRVVVAIHSLWPVGYNQELPAHRRVFLKALVQAVSQGPRNVLKGNAGARGALAELEVQVYFTNPKLPEWANTCGAGEFVKRKVKPTKRVAEAALRLLFAGPTAEERAKGMESLSPLGAYYLGVSIKDGTAVVNFRRGAEKYLYVFGPVCQQERVLTPIVKTLKQFSTIRSVDFAINGKIIEEWDA